MKKAIRTALLALGLYFLVTWALAAVSLEKGFGRRDTIPPVELTYTEETKNTCPRREVTFPSGKNMLHGWLYSDEDLQDDAGLILVVHGLGGGANTHLAETLAFAEHGYLVLSYDGTGTRESEGRGVRGLYQATCDLDAALAYVQTEEELKDLPVFVYGHSAGGYAAAAVLADHPEIDGVICISAFDRPLEEMMAQAKKRAGIAAYLGYPGLALQYAILFGADANRSAADALSVSQIPALIIAGSDDKVVPYPVSLYACKDRISDPYAAFLLVEDSYRNGHNGLWLTADANRARELAAQQKTAADPAACNELDPTFMSTVFAFLDETARTAE